MTVSKWPLWLENGSSGHLLKDMSFAKIDGFPDKVHIVETIGNSLDLFENGLVVLINSECNGIPHNLREIPAIHTASQWRIRLLIIVIYSGLRSLLKLKD